MGARISVMGMRTTATRVYNDAIHDLPVTVATRISWSTITAAAEKTSTAGKGSSNTDGMCTHVPA